MDKGYEVDLYDCITRKMTSEDTVELVKKSNADYLMAEITTSTCEYDFEVLRMIKKQVPNIKLLSGVHMLQLYLKVF